MTNCKLVSVWVKPRFMYCQRPEPLCGEALMHFSPLIRSNSFSWSFNFYARYVLFQVSRIKAVSDNCLISITMIEVIWMVEGVINIWLILRRTWEIVTQSMKLILFLNNKWEIDMNFLISFLFQIQKSSCQGCGLETQKSWVSYSYRAGCCSVRLCRFYSFLYREIVVVV